MGVDVMHYRTGQRPAKFWSLMGPMFASAKVRAALVTLHDDPDTDEWWLVTDDKGLAGFACLRIGKASAELCHHWTREDLREKGLAGTLAQLSIDRAKELDVKRLRIVVGPNRVDTFKKLSFVAGKARGSYTSMERDL